MDDDKTLLLLLLLCCLLSSRPNKEDPIIKSSTSRVEANDMRISVKRHPASKLLFFFWIVSMMIDGVCSCCRRRNFGMRQHNPSNKLRITSVVKLVTKRMIFFVEESN
jgi:hypothetical protein